jgi:hypothetical protein
MWAMPIPYDRIQVIIRIPDGSGGFDDTEIYYQGNTGVRNQFFDNPNESIESTITIFVKARVICNQYSFPMDMGAQSTVSLAVDGPSLPIARTDYYTITAGYGTAVTLSPSVMNNDEDPDGDAIEVVANAGTTAFGGTYSITSDGIVVYTPPSSVWVGQDVFQYTLRKVYNHALYYFAQVYVTSASGIIPVWAKIVETGTGSGRTIVINYYSDSSGTVAVDVTGFGLVVNYKKSVYHDATGSHTSPGYYITNLTVSPTGSTTLISIGEGTGTTYSLQTGTGYTAI